MEAQEVTIARGQGSIDTARQPVRASQTFSPREFWSRVSEVDSVVPGQPGRATEVLRLLEESPALTPDEVTLAVGRLCGFAASYEEQSREVLREVVKRQHEARGQ